MNYRTAKLLAETNYTAAATTTIDINVKDPISRIIIAWRVTRAGNGMDSFPHSDISKIELIDGSEVLHSLSGGENQAVAIYDRKSQTMNHGQHVASNSEYSSYGIDFGRWLNDPMFAFDPRRFTNPQLKITHSHLISDTGASSGNLEVWACMFDEKQISPVGFLATRQIKDFTVATAGIFNTVDLPVDRTMRALFIQGYEAGKEPWYQVIEARLNEDTDKRVVFDWDLEDYHRLRKGWDHSIQEQCIGIAGTSTLNYYVTPTDFYVIPLLSGIQNDTTTQPEAYARGGKAPIQAETDNTTFLGLMHGWLPNHMFHFPFGDPMDPTDWYDLSQVGSLELRVKTGTNTSGNIRTSVQQVRIY
ncbi:hypothetical protein LCGC14_1618690 [marine sediment metagenome]|uniref:Uncharacterized protein n=1 Tax=marine sediment metagenome TaxID=412755 RepID=A0A0F9I6F9_9ZZZZ